MSGDRIHYWRISMGQLDGNQFIITSQEYEPLYLALYREGELHKRVKEGLAELENCHVCPRNCGVNRLEGETAVCKSGRYAVVASYNPHLGEEDPLRGWRGSGTIFFSWCNLRCVFCQNFDISHQGQGREVTNEELAGLMLALQNQGCHNINFVTPSHVVPQILAAVEIAARRGLSIPLVYNTGGYDRVSTLKLLDGVFDIYMPDFKFWDRHVADEACRASDYPAVARRALKEMHRQVGDLIIDEAGIARRGLLVRHLVLPNGLAGTEDIMTYIAHNISENTYVNIMAQYRPCGQAREVKALAAPLSRDVYRAALQAAEKSGIRRLDKPRRVFMFG